MAGMTGRRPRDPFPRLRWLRRCLWVVLLALPVVWPWVRDLFG